MTHWDEGEWASPPHPQETTMTTEFAGLIEADCWTCANKRLAESGGPLGGSFMGHPAMYSKCGNKRCPCAAHHDNPCTGSNEPGQPGSLYPAIDPTALRPTLAEMLTKLDGYRNEARR